MIKHLHLFLSAALCAALMMPATVMADPLPEPAPAKTQAQKAREARAKAKAKEDRKKYAHNKLDLYQIHHLSMWGGVGYSGIVNSPKQYSKFIGGGGGLFGFGYEWHDKKFQLALGPELRFFSSQDNLNLPGNGLNPAVTGLGVYSVQGTGNLYATTMYKNYTFTKFHETQTVGQVMLPITLGAQFDDIPLYFMVGAKIGYTFLSNWSHRARLTTSVTEQLAMDEWFNVPTHDLLTNQKYTMKGTNTALKGTLDAVITAEIGVKINGFLSEEWNKNNEAQRFPWHMRVALFLDYGLPLIRLGESVPTDHVMTVYPTEEKVTTTSFMTSAGAPTKFNSLLVGAKFTALLQLNRPKKMKPENPYLVVQLCDYFTHKPLNNAGVTMLTTNLRTNKVSKKGPNGKGFSVQRLTPDDYEVKIAKAGYLPIDPINVTLIEGENNNLKQRMDTTFVYLIPEPVFTCTVVDEKTGKRIPARLEFFEEDPSKPEKTLTHDTASAEGTSLKLTVGKTYMVSVSADNYIAQIFTVGYQGIQSLSASYALTPVERGKTYIIQNLFFATNETVILEQSEPSLVQLFEFLNDNPGIRIRITGHTDSVGKDEANQILSEGRANSVKQSMVQRGIDPDRIETEGKGESMPIDTNDTEEGRQNNRRVEFTVL